MEDFNNVAVLIAAAAASSSAPLSEAHEQEGVPDAASRKPDADSLIQVIEKLSKIVEKRPQRRCTLMGHKRVQARAGGGGSPYKKLSVEHMDGDFNNNGGERKRAVTCYQCSLCPYLSPELALLKDHLKQHNEHNQDLILMCSECRFSSRDQAQLEEHVRMHLESGADADGGENRAGGDADADTVGSEREGDAERHQQKKKKKWYVYEEYGLYRCLICSYVCSQQRMLKTHAWKHAGLLDCSYPVFEEDEEKATSALPSEPAGREAESQIASAAFKQRAPLPDESTPSPARGAKEDQSQLDVKELSPEESGMEVQVTAEGDADAASVADSLLTSAQKIINSDPNSAGHINVIVERLPSAEDGVMAPAPLLLDPEVDAGQSLLGVPEEEHARSADPPRDENVPPAGRKRTHSESLRLHSLAAEVLVAMPMRTPELKPEAASAVERRGNADEGSGFLHKYGKNPEGPVGAAAANAGISSSLLTVIERLRERSDQDASDEDILKELQDNANAVPEDPGASPDGGLVDFVAGSERPYRCRLCRYSSGNKGYVKQHLRVHRRRQPYQCPICEHVAADSQDLETHMIHHCKTRTYQCETCSQAFHYKTQLRSHEQEHHSSVGADADETAAAAEAERDADEGVLHKTFKCDVCDYTSATYVGVRNHRRIHNSDKPYRCCNCDFATTNMNSLKSHMRKHPQEQQAVQLLEQYRCSLCGYVCSHPPSLKSHMWKHAGDQNYNYEQVNKAINEAISQSSRAPAKASMGAETLTSSSQDTAKVLAEQPLEAPVGVPKSSPGPSSPQRSSPSPSPVQVQVQVQVPPPGGGVEYCVLLFCCCICGLESPSKERLMEHMKEHEGDLISIILNNKDAHAYTQAAHKKTQSNGDLRQGQPRTICFVFKSSLPEHIYIVVSLFVCFSQLKYGWVSFTLSL
ncbi:zinc finger protein 507 isoform X2 [Syngnathoides biaculeatus]|uniref:zinc finger protein 507 isoform X2 n=1 Tax=Syngnathoides biaculeatus TaxID=300417 RepID=UPI002ADD91FD|nr:zinc finger protein 507 isoform X2 [Syngnathoides biaculeatus]